MDNSFKAQVHRSAGGQLPHFATKGDSNIPAEVAAKLAAVIRARMLGH